MQTKQTDIYADFPEYQHGYKNHIQQCRVDETHGKSWEKPRHAKKFVAKLTAGNAKLGVREQEQEASNIEAWENSYYS